MLCQRDIFWGQILYPFTASEHLNHGQLCMNVFIFIKGSLNSKKKRGRSLLKSVLWFPSFLFTLSNLPLLPPIKRCLCTDQKNWGHHYVCIVRAWLKERLMFTEVAVLHWFILRWKKQNGRMAVYSRKWQRPVELNECNLEKAKVLKRVTILLRWCTNCKT